MSAKHRRSTSSPNLSVRQAALQVLGAVRQINRYRDAAAALPGFDVREFDQLSHYATAALSAEAFLERAESSLDGIAQTRIELAAAARKERDVLRRALVPLVEAGLLSKRPIYALPRGRSHAGVAAEIRLVCAVFERHRKVIDGKTVIDTARVESAMAKASALAATLAPAAESDLAMAIEGRNIAFQRLLATYDEVRRAIEFLRPRHVDLADLAPSLFAKHGRPAARRSTRTVALAPTPRATASVSSAGSLPC